ncbi:hypothetical protein EVAR_33117_1 [Eumeta japonica]|uniref:Uncharacterized protein n=1 Tax=Eumeta variegata TaxID=151549 RepID=A0A4C1Y9T7_EUMVA|nr:hypothetical protein EVAR_33117_1 [Eumeta japonica]
MNEGVQAAQRRRQLPPAGASEAMQVDDVIAPISALEYVDIDYGRGANEQVNHQRVDGHYRPYILRDKNHQLLYYERKFTRVFLLESRLLERVYGAGAPQRRGAAVRRQ